MHKVILKGFIKEASMLPVKYDPIFALKQGGSAVKRRGKGMKGLILSPLLSALLYGGATGGATYGAAKYVNKRRKEYSKLTKKQKKEQEEVLLPESIALGSILGGLGALASAKAGLPVVPTVGLGLVTGLAIPETLVKQDKQISNPEALSLGAGLLGGVLAGRLKLNQLRNLNLKNALGLDEKIPSVDDLDKFRNFAKHDDVVRTVVTPTVHGGPEVSRETGSSLYKKFESRKDMLNNPYISDGLKMANPGVQYMFGVRETANRILDTVKKVKPTSDSLRDRIKDTMLSMGTKERANYFHPDRLKYNKLLNKEEKRIASELYSKYSGYSKGGKPKNAGTKNSQEDSWEGLLDFLIKKDKEILKKKKNPFKLF